MNTASRLQPLLQQLPFALDDTERLNAVYDRWARTGAPSDREVLDIWTYCYIWRYFLAKAARDALRRPSDIDDMVATAFRRTCRTRMDVSGVVRYAHWVSVICRNTFVNYAHRARDTEPIDDLDIAAVAEPAPAYDDTPHIRRALRAAIARLPAYLQDTARLFFLDGCTFETIAASVGKSVATIRTYKCRALHALRRDPDLRCASGRLATADP
jgi:RNA polymerase sigma factor (sigma-70 family)